MTLLFFLAEIVYFSVTYAYDAKPEIPVQIILIWDSEFGDMSNSLFEREVQKQTHLSD